MMPNCRDIEIIDSFSVGAIQKLIKSISTDAIGWVLFLNFRFQYVPVKATVPSYLLFGIFIALFIPPSNFGSIVAHYYFSMTLHPHVSPLPQVPPNLNPIDQRLIHFKSRTAFACQRLPVHVPSHDQVLKR
jgi:hypothetical protein